MPWNKQTGRASASGCLSRRPRLPFAWGNDDLPFLKPVKSAMLAAKPRVSSQFQLKGRIDGVPRGRAIVTLTEQGESPHGSLQVGARD